MSKVKDSKDSTQWILRISADFQYMMASRRLERRCFLGVVVENISTKIQERLKLESDEGVWVRNIILGSPAHEANMMVDDIIIEANAIKINKREQLIHMLRSYGCNDLMQFVIIRKNNNFSIQVPLTEFPQEANDEFEIHYSHVESSGRRLRTIITRPDGGGKYPAIFFIQGLGCTSVDYPLTENHPYKKILYGLTKRGFVTIRVEKSGTGDSEGRPCKDIDFFAERDDYLATLKNVFELDFVNSKRIFIFGHSMGGVFAPMIGKEVDLKGMAISGTIVKTWAEYTLENRYRQLQLANKYIGDISKDSGTLRRFLSNAKEQHPQSTAGSYPERAVYFCGKTYGHQRHHRFFQQLSSINLVNIWEEIRVPTLIIWGKGDYVSSLEDHLAIYDILVKHNPPIKARFLKLGIDHEFHKVENMERSFSKHYDADFNTQIISEITTWFQHID